MTLELKITPECPNCNYETYVTWDFDLPGYFDHEKPHKIHFICQNCDYEWVDDRKPYL